MQAKESGQQSVSSYCGIATFETAPSAGIRSQADAIIEVSSSAFTRSRSPSGPS
jgi:hypothetical protein